MSYNENDYLKAQLQLFPQGTIWVENIENSKSDVVNICKVWAKEYVRFNIKLDELVQQSSPITATETLEDWALSIGLNPNNYNSSDAIRLAIVQQLDKSNNNNYKQHEQLSSYFNFELFDIKHFQHEIKFGTYCFGKEMNGRFSEVFYEFINKININTIRTSANVPNDFRISSFGSYSFGKSMYQINSWLYYINMVLGAYINMYQNGVAAIKLASIIPIFTYVGWFE